LEGQTATEDLNAEANPEPSMPTGRQICPMVPQTQEGTSTCGPPYCAETTQLTCENTCWSTCNSTCSTCAGQSTCDNTCASTCVGGACVSWRFYGTVYWLDNAYGGSGSWWVAPGRYAQLCNVHAQSTGDGGFTRLYLSSKQIDLVGFNVYNGSYDKTISHTPYNGWWALSGISAVGNNCTTNWWQIGDGPEYSSGPSGSNNVNPVVRLYPWLP
jgi:hypothetical protein